MLNLTQYFYNHIKDKRPFWIHLGCINMILLTTQRQNTLHIESTVHAVAGHTLASFFKVVIFK